MTEENQIGGLGGLKLVPSNVYEKTEKKEFQCDIRYINLFGTGLYTTVEMDLVPKIFDKYGIQYFIQYQRKEISPNSSGIVFALKIVMPTKYQATKIHYTIYICKPTDEKVSYYYMKGCCEHKYTFDGNISGQNGTGGFGLEDAPVQVSCEDLENRYMGEGKYDGNVKICVIIGAIDLKLKPDYMIYKIYQKIYPTDFEQSIICLTNEINNIIKQREQSEINIKQINEKKEIIIKEKQYHNDNEYEPIGKKMSILSEVNGRLKLRKRSLQERILQLDEQLSENNIHEFLKNLEPKDYPLKSFTKFELEQLLNKILRLQIKIFKRLNDEQNCGICMERRPDCILRPCSHVFCGTCIVEQLSTSKLCPKCMEPFTDRTMLTI